MWVDGYLWEWTMKMVDKRIVSLCSWGLFSLCIIFTNKGLASLGEKGGVHKHFVPAG